VTIYTDMPLDKKVSMYVVKVPLAEAMATLTANAGGHWNLGFFAAPTSAGVKEEIRNFQAGNTGDDVKSYSYPTMMDALTGGDADIPEPDPRGQSWPGYHPPTAALSARTGGGQGGQDTASAQPPAAPTTVQDYFHAFAEEADILIMAPSSWAPNVPAPAANASIVHAVNNLVSSAHGSVEEAIVLRDSGRGGRGSRGGGGFGGDTGWSYMEDRVKNEISALPEEDRAAATSQLQDEDKFRKDVENAPPDARMGMMAQHMEAAGEHRFSRMAPKARARMYERIVSNRQAATGQGQ
jgi:hypothetical protein